MMLRTLAAAAALTLFAGTAHAQQAQKTEVGDWTVYSNDDNCRALTEFNGGTMFSVALYKGNSRTTIMILNDKTFADAVSTKPYDAKLAFVKGETLITDWLDLPVLGVVLDNGSKGAYIAASGDGLLTTLGNADVTGLLRGTDAVISVKTAPAGDVVAALRKCVAGK